MAGQLNPWDEGDARRLRRTENLKDGAFCEYVCEVLQAMPIQNGKSRVLVVTDYTENPHLPYYDHHKATTPQGRRSIKHSRMSETIELAMHGTRPNQWVKPKRSVVILDEQHHLVRELLK
ncbi:hypothetical protein BGW41_005676 [Actinomortierella wolfii]|nr:hypothetical protein BGW41_005676 [Actinomortierella wolfii]